MHRLRAIHITYPTPPPPFSPIKMSQVCFLVGQEFKFKRCISPVVLAENSCQSSLGLSPDWGFTALEKGNESPGSVFWEEESRTEASSDKAHSLDYVSGLRRRGVLLLFEWSPGVYLETNVRVKIPFSRKYRFIVSPRSELSAIPGLQQTL